MTQIFEQTVAIQGGPGSYHEEAAAQLQQEIGAKTLAYVDTFDDVFDGLLSAEWDSALVAIANNSVGFIAEPHARLINTPESFKIVGETYVRVDHQLLALPGAKLEEIKEVHSQAPALGQCSKYLAHVLPKAIIIEQHDTAGSAELVAGWHDLTKAAIASARAGSLHGLAPIAESIQDDSDNITRFLLVSNSKDTHPTFEIANKSTWLLDTGQKPGALHAALGPFSEYGVGISSLHSRFIPNSAFDMEFWMDIEADEQSEEMLQIRAKLERLGCTIRSLGSYASSTVPMLESMPNK